MERASNVPPFRKTRESIGHLGNYFSFRSDGVNVTPPFANAEHGIAWLELRHRSSDRRYLARDIYAGSLALHAPVQRIDGSGANPYDDFVVLRNGLFEVLHFEDLPQSGLGINGGFHVG